MAENKNKEAQTAAPEAQTAAAEETPPKLSDAQIDAEVKSIGRMLDKGRKVRIRIPFNDLNPKDTIVPVCVNGHLYKIKRGESVEVPEVVSKILENAKYI